MSNRRSTHAVNLAISLAEGVVMPHPSRVDNDLEDKEIAAVQARLAERFPQLDTDTIAAAVRLAHSELTGGIRDFVPVLVEHNARNRLSAIADREPSTDAEPDEKGEQSATS
jgi:hypothetical protein